MAGATSHAVNRVEDGCGGDRGMFNAQFLNNMFRRERRQMGLWCRSNQGFGERQTSASRRRLQDDVDVLRSTEAMREMDVPDTLGETRHVIAIGSELLRNGRMRDDDAWNCGSVIRPDENGRWASGISTIVHRDTQETDADGMMYDCPPGHTRNRRRRDDVRDGRHQRDGRWYG